MSWPCYDTAWPEKLLNLYHSLKKGITMVSGKLSLPADSFEVWREHQLGKIKIMEEELKRLNLLEHPCEIQALCSEVSAIKGMIRIKQRALTRRQ